MPAEFEPGAKLDRMRGNLDHPEAALRQIGALMVAESQQAFREQKHAGKAWDPRGKVNVFGIIADFYEGRQPPARRFERRPVLKDTGRLSASIAFQVLSGGQVVEVGTVLPYAAVHQHGGAVESRPINETVRSVLNEFLKGNGKKWRKQLGWLLNKKFAGKTIKGKVPARPFVGITKQTIDDVQEVVRVKILEAE